MFVSQEKFWSDYRIQNGQAPNETVLNRGTMRLKREIRELKSLVDIISNQDIEEYSPSMIYEQDEYVQKDGSYYRSKCDHNYANDVLNKNYWELCTLPSIKDATTRTHFQKYISINDQDTFRTDFKMSERPMVFIDGILQDISMYTYGSNSVVLSEPLTAGRRVLVLYGYTYTAAMLLPKRQFISEYDQDRFTVPFQLIEPNVFVNGVLQNEESYIFGRDYVQFPQGLKEGTVVTISNGNAVGTDFYNKVETDELFTHYYTKGETYSSSVLDNKFAEKADLAYTDVAYRFKSDSYSIDEINGILSNYVLNDYFVSAMDEKANWGETLAEYRITDAYTKVEIENYIDNIWEKQFADGRLRNELDAKANWNTTLEGYGIDNAYTIAQVDERLNEKLDKDNFNTLEILDRINGNIDLNAMQLNGFASSQFMRSDVKTENYGGIEVYPEDYEHIKRNVAIDESITGREFVRRGQFQENEYYHDNVRDMYINIEGEFKGDFDFNIINTGISTPDEYNWTVYVQPTISGNRCDYVPEKYGNGYLFNKEIHDAKTWEHTFYHFGFVEIIGTLTRSYVVHLKSFYRNGELELIPSPAHYKLVGVRKRGSTFVRFNQGDTKRDAIPYESISDNESVYSKMTRYDLLETNVGNALNDTFYHSPKTLPYHVVGHANKYEHVTNNEIQAVFCGLKPNADVFFEFDQDVNISESDLVADVNGNAHIVFSYHMQGTVIVSCYGEDSDTGYIKFNIQDTYDDDPDTTLVFDDSTFDHNVFTNGTTTYPLPETKKFNLYVEHLVTELFENEVYTLSVETDAPNIEVIPDGDYLTKFKVENVLDDHEENETETEDKNGINKFVITIEGHVDDADEDIVLKVKTTNDVPSRDVSLDVNIKVKKIIMNLPDKISVPISQSILVPFETNIPYDEIVVDIDRINAVAKLNVDDRTLTVDGVILGASEMTIIGKGKTIKREVVVYEPDNPLETGTEDIPDDEIIDLGE